MAVKRLTRPAGSSTGNCVRDSVVAGTKIKGRPEKSERHFCFFGCSWFLRCCATLPAENSVRDTFLLARARRLLVGALTYLFLVSLTLAQEHSGASITTCTGKTCTTITEPGAVKIENLWKQADFVAVVQILSGDTEHYPIAVYKAKVITPFKNASTGQIIYLGPFTTYRLGGEYLAFLRQSKDPVSPKDGDAPLSYGTLQTVLRIMYEGYSFMDIDYACVFDGKNTNERCDYGIKISTEKVLLPKSIKTFPDGTSGGAGEHSWVRRDKFLKFLERFVESK